MEKRIKHVIAVASGKGGVGKSSATALIASGLARKGYQVGVMDADITGPSIPKILGLSGHPEKGENDFINPMVSKGGIKAISINLLLEDASQPVIWRGPLVGKIVGQFFNEVNWGELDFLMIDMPPGTGDVPLTVLQSCDVEGVVMVTTPQDLAGMVVGKAVHMTEKMDKKVIGIIENMSYAVCPQCKTVIEIFGESHGDELAKKFNLPILGRLPIDPHFTKLSDQGRLDEYAFGEELDGIIDQIEAFVQKDS